MTAQTGSKKSGKKSPSVDSRDLKNHLIGDSDVYELALRHAAIWDWDIAADTVHFSAGFRQLLGYDEAEFSKILDASITSIVHPDDLERYRAALDHHLSNPEQLFDSEHRFRIKSGDYRWFHARGQAICDASGKPIHSVGVLLDIHEARSLAELREEALKRAGQAEQRLRDAIDSLQEGFVLYDADDRLVICNKKYHELYAISSDMLIPGNHFEDIIRVGAQRGQYRAAIGRVDEWVEERIANHRAANATIEQELTDGRCLMIHEHRTPDGGTVGFRVDVTSLRLMARELESASKGAEDANRAKSEFLASMSHELRTPLNAILGFTQLMQMKMPAEDPLKLREYSDYILTSGNHLLSLINEILDLSKVEAGRMRMMIEAVDCVTAIHDSIDHIRPQAEQRGIIIQEPDPTVTVCIAHADEFRLKQCLINLLSNAVKFNRDSGSIRVRVEENRDGFARITVSDTGLGIPAEDFERIFQPFHQASIDAAVAHAGTGIGLTLTKQLVEEMGGRIGFTSQEGKGSTFWIDLANGNI